MVPIAKGYRRPTKERLLQMIPWETDSRINEILAEILSEVEAKCSKANLSNIGYSHLIYAFLGTLEKHKSGRVQTQEKKFKELGMLLKESKWINAYWVDEAYFNGQTVRDFTTFCNSLSTLNGRLVMTKGFNGHNPARFLIRFEV